MSNPSASESRSVLVKRKRKKPPGISRGLPPSTTHLCRFGSFLLQLLALVLRRFGRLSLLGFGTGCFGALHMLHHDRLGIFFIVQADQQAVIGSQVNPVRQL